MEKLKVGIIGTGGIANAHARAYQQIPEVEMVAVADIIPERAQAFAERWGVQRWYSHHQEMLEKEQLDLVSITTYNNAHRGPTVDALQAGVNVLVEKPMSATLEDALEMLRAARKSKRLLMVGLKQRYSPSLKVAKRIMDSGALGHVYFAETAGGRRRGIPGGSFTLQETAGGGAVVDIGVYSLDTVLWLLNHPLPKRVSGVTYCHIGKQPGPPPLGSWHWNPETMEVEEFGAAFIRFEGDLTLNFKISWAMNLDSLGSTYFLGTKAGLRLSPLELYRDEFGCMTTVTFQGLPQEPDTFKEEILDFIRAIRNHLPSPIPPEQAILTNIIMDAIYRSAEAGEEVKVEIPEEVKACLGKEVKADIQ